LLAPPNPLEDGGGRLFDARPDARAFDTDVCCSSKTNVVTTIGRRNDVEALNVRCMLSWIRMTRTTRM
jgi:hypothetical protein